MSWFRIEGKLPQHKKYAPLSDAAFRLAVTAGCWCAEGYTDGTIPKAMVPALTRAPSGRKLRAAIDELLKNGIWADRESDFELHDFLDWNMSREQWEAKKEAAKAGGDAKYANSKKTAPAKSLPHGKPHGTAPGTPDAMPDASDMACQDSSSRQADGIAHALPDSDSENEVEEREKIKSDYSTIVDHYFAEFERRRGCRPIFGPRDGKSVKNLLKKVNNDVALVMTIITNAFDSWQSDTMSIAIISNDPTRFAGSSTKKPQSTCPDRIQFTQQHHDLCRRGSLNINDVWTESKNRYRSNGQVSCDWQAAFTATLMRRIENLERDAATRANGQPSAKTPPVTRPERSGATVGQQRPETPPSANPEPRRDISKVLGKFGGPDA